MDHLEDEEWRQVPSFPEIEASSWGRVRRVERVRKGRAPVPTYGSVRITKSRGGRYSYSVRTVHYKGVKTRLLHRLVCEAFHGRPPLDLADPVAIHLDDDTDNNRPENLRWGTRLENSNTGRFRDVCRARGFVRNRGKIVRFTEPGLEAMAQQAA